MARRQLSDAENDIIRTGARTGLACGAIINQLRAAGYDRSKGAVLGSEPFRAGRDAYRLARKQAQKISLDAGARAKAAKAAGAAPIYQALSDRIIFDAARGGASLNTIADALQAAGCGSPCPSTISRSAPYREAKGLASEKRVPQPWTARETEIVIEGARRGLNGPTLRKALADAGFERVLRCITASTYYAKGRQLGREDAERAALEASATQAATLPEPASPAPVQAAPRFVRRHPDFPGVSLAVVAIQKDWGEVVAR